MAAPQLRPEQPDSGPRRRFDLALTKLNRLLAGLANISLWLLTGVVVLQVIARHLGHPFVWSDEVSVYLMLMLSFIGIAHTWSEDGHFRITLLTHILSTNAQRILRLIVLIFSLLFTVAFTYGAYKLTSFSFMLGFTTPTALKLPVGVIQGLVFLGGVFLTLAIVQDIIGEFLRRERAEHNITDILQ